MAPRSSASAPRRWLRRALLAALTLGMLISFTQMGAGGFLAPFLTTLVFLLELGAVRQGYLKRLFTPFVLLGLSWIVTPYAAHTLHRAELAALVAQQLLVVFLPKRRHWLLGRLYRLLTASHTQPEPRSTPHSGGVPRDFQAPYTPPSRITKRDLGGCVVYGRPGSHIGGNSAFDAQATDLGHRGEVIVGEHMEYMAAGAPVVLYHGLRYDPHNLRSQADLDHAMLVNNTLVIVDAKLWHKGANYCWGSDGQVLRDGQSFPGGEHISMVDAVSKWQSFLAPHNINVCALVVNANGGTVDNEGQPDGVALATLDDITLLLDRARDAAEPNRVVEEKIRSRMFPDLPVAA